MLNLIITGLFLISVAVAAASIVIVSQLRSKFRLDFLLYMQVFYFMFGFYVLWGQVVIVSFLAPLISKPAIYKLHDVSVLLGTPFIVFGWLMFIKFIHDFIGLKPRRFFNTIFLAFNIVFLLVVGFWNSRLPQMRTLDILKYYFILSNLIYACFAGVALLKNHGRLRLMKGEPLKLMAAGILLFMIVQNGALVLYHSQLWVVLVFIFLFFAGTAFIPLFLKYNLQPEASPVEVAPGNSFENFCIKYEISPREKEIIREICNGLTNQQIADKLFISLQTVKDHTHRIYGKTMTSSRMQLMKMVQQLS